MKNLLLFFSFLVGLTACEAQPVPIKYGKDACHLCKMTLTDKRFGAEIVTKKGKAFKFDDLNCMINYLNSNETPADQIAMKLAVDFVSNQLIDAEKAVFYHSSVNFRSPMRGDVAAFADPQIAEKTAQEAKETRKLTWAELPSVFK